MHNSGHVSKLTVILLSICSLFSMSRCALAEPMDAVSLFVNQCLDYSSEFHADFSSATALERQTIGLQNLVDRLQYYRQFRLSDDDKEWLLQCQLSVADTMNKLLSNSQMTAFIARELTSGDPQRQALAKRYRNFQAQQLSEADKLKLTTAKTAIKQRLKSSSFQLELGECALAPSENETHNRLSSTIVKYLLQQPNEACRKTVWQTYQQRAVEYVASDLGMLLQIQEQLANRQGFEHYTDAAFSHTLLASAINAHDFLAALKRPINVAPWNIGQSLKATAKTNFTRMTRAQYLSNLTTTLRPLGIELETVTDNWLRLWHEQRLLGDIMLAQGSNHAMLLRYSVVGRQTGLARLTLKDEFTRITDLQQANNAVAEVLAMMAAGGKYYLLNNVHEYQDTNELAALWLSAYLDQQLHAAFDANSREALFDSYQTQMERIKAVSALTFYTADDSISLTTEFRQVFAESWQDAAVMPFTFYGISDLGPLYLVHLFQQQLAYALQRETMNCNPADLFNVIVVNEEQHNADYLIHRVWPNGGIRQFIAQFHAGQYSPSLSTQCNF
ncbi:hypothetical protein HR45_11185 [Shewanella mangrovi]|uniref:Peptidase M3A/M3B catalytic domain-containing protein n=1 Tax=Shewanella mangrovi TaxID=1515746 RepID=A0A094JGS9_9GAMM|nr:hypothetical protein [Shewanella mangrovi]KFZ37239.1 hypothetical protein HR45_11185 [Shewanella mangrovi]